MITYPGGATTTSTSTSTTTKPSPQPVPAAKPTTDRFMLSTKRKGLNWIGLNLDHHHHNNNKRNDDEKPIGKGSFKATKQKHSNDWQQAADINRSKSDVHNDASATAASAGGFPSTPISHNNRYESSHFSFTNGDRKASVPNSTSYLSKLTFSTNKTAKEKRLLGSPRLHRAASSIFGRKNVESPTIDSHHHHHHLHHHQQQQQHPNFTQFDPFATKYNSNNDYGSLSNAASGNCSNDATATNTSHHHDSFNEIGGSTGFLPTLSPPSLGNTSDQNIEYPPVFVPETYSLRDPNVTH